MFFPFPLPLVYIIAKFLIKVKSNSKWKTKWWRCRRTSPLRFG
uniref:Uncharacterized protein n=1 Tax=Siphoviridae sp. ctTnV63 TaxID=2825523 RepID=A0A8S5NX73_9CAUD|nr:MAG TPA: hypothetical protein [Siphoviridae sp. ctTnV63]